MRRDTVCTGQTSEVKERNSNQDVVGRQTEDALHKMEVVDGEDGVKGEWHEDFRTSLIVAARHIG